MAVIEKFFVQIPAFWFFTESSLLLFVLLNVTFLFLLLCVSHGVACTCHRRWNPRFPSERTHLHLCDTQGLGAGDGFSEKLYRLAVIPVHRPVPCRLWEGLIGTAYSQSATLDSVGNAITPCCEDRRAITQWVLWAPETPALWYRETLACSPARPPAPVCDMAVGRTGDTVVLYLTVHTCPWVWIFSQVFMQQTPSGCAKCELAHLPSHSIKCLQGEGLVLSHLVESPEFLAACPHLCCRFPEGRELYLLKSRSLKNGLPLASQTYLLSFLNLRQTQSDGTERG